MSIVRVVVFFVLTALVLVLVRLSYLHDLEYFAPATGAAQAPPSAFVDYVTRPELDLLTSPLVSAVNGVVDAINTIPKAVCTNVIDMSSAIGNKIKEYGETLQTHARSPDDDPSTLGSVSVYSSNKDFLDRIKASNTPLFSTLASNADSFYTVPFDEQDAALAEIIRTLHPWVHVT